MEFTRLVKRLSPKLKAIAYRLNHNHTFFNDEDLYQEALVHLWKLMQGKGLSDKTDSYILQGCYFHLKNYIRTHRDRIRPLHIEALTRDGEEASGGFELKDEHAEGFFDRLNDSLLADVIRNNGLSPREKELLPLFSEGLTTREIGRRVGVSHVRVIKMRREISRKCRKYLDKI